MSPVSHFFEHMIKAPDASIGFFPSWFAAAQPDWPQPFIEGDFIDIGNGQTKATLSAELEQFLSDGEPPLVFTPGTGHRHAASYFNNALTVSQQLGRRALFVTPYSEQLPKSLPANIMWVSHAPFSVLLLRVALIAHHGRIGTMTEAFRAGIPQLIVPFEYDQFDNGLRAKRLGVADVLSAKALGVQDMRRKIEGLLSSSEIKPKLVMIAGKLAQSDSEKLLALIESALFPQGHLEK